MFTHDYFASGFFSPDYFPPAAIADNSNFFLGDYFEKSYFLQEYFPGGSSTPPPPVVNTADTHDYPHDYWKHHRKKIKAQMLAYEQSKYRNTSAAEIAADIYAQRKPARPVLKLRAPDPREIAMAAAEAEYQKLLQDDEEAIIWLLQ